MIHKEWLRDHVVVQLDAHIAAYESNIAQKLADMGVWTHQSCINIDDIRQQTFGKVTVTAEFLVFVSVITLTNKLTKI